MDEEITNKKECPNPKCKSTDVKDQGWSHGGGAGFVPPANKHQYKCQKCGKIFLYVGGNP